MKIFNVFQEPDALHILSADCKDESEYYNAVMQAASRFSTTFQLGFFQWIQQAGYKSVLDFCKKDFKARQSDDLGLCDAAHEWITRNFSDSNEPKN